MSEYQVQFRSITKLFYNGHYEEGRALINELIQNTPQNSMLYINRALFSSQLGEDLSAMDDLEKAIEMNPFNYLAYFNLFSVLTRCNEDWEAFNNLCCSLSCMYLLKAKTTKKIDLVEKSLQYANNNVAASLLKKCLELEYTFLAEGAASQDQSDNDLQKLLKQSRNEEFFGKAIEMIGFNQQFRLKSSINPPQFIDLSQQINEKIKQFNELYGQLNYEFGAITQKVPKESQISNNIEAFMRQKSKISTSNRESMIAILENDDFFSESNKKSSLNLHPLQETNPQSMEDLQKYHQEVKQSHQQQDKNIYNPNQLKLEDPFQSKNQFSSIIQEKSMEYDDQKLSSIKSEQDPSTNRHIYPLRNNKYLKINLLSFVFLQAPKIAPKNVYCVISYNNQVKFRSYHVRCDDQICVWNESFVPIQISAEPSLLVLRVFNKIFNDIHDEKIGEIQVMIDIADLLKLPLYSKEGELVGQILVHLQVSDKLEGVQ